MSKRTDRTSGGTEDFQEAVKRNVEAEALIAGKPRIKAQEDVLTDELPEAWTGKKTFVWMSVAFRTSSGFIAVN